MLGDRAPQSPRLGFTLVEMVVSLALTGIVLAMVSAISLRQQRIFADLVEQTAAAARLREASAILPIHLRSAAPLDIREARDTSLELRATIASAVVCDTTASALVLAPVGRNAPLASIVAPMEAGDSAWLFSNDRSGDGWRGFVITAAGTRAPGVCGAPGPSLSDAQLHTSRTTLSIAPLPPAAIGTALRVTRPLRYSLYRAGDGAWYIGERDWSNSDARFNAIQPIAGPYLAPAAGGLRFRYADSTGAALATPVGDRSAIATIDVEMRSQTENPTRVLGAGTARGRRIDSTVFTIALRNRR